MPSKKTTLWTEEGGGEAQQPLLVPFHKALEKSQFNATYHEEVERSVLDHVNMLYVAFTRAEERLYIFAPSEKPKTDSTEMLRVSQLLLAVSDKLWPQRPESDRVERGIPIPRLEATHFPPTQVPLWVSERWRDRIRVEKKFHRYRDLFSENSEEEGTPFLVVVREALRKMNLANEVEQTLTDLREQGLVNEERSAPLRTKLERLLLHSDLGPWFQPNGRIPLTAEVLTPDGELIRPDKMYRTQEGVKVLQFTQSSWEEEDRSLLAHLVQEASDTGESLQAWLFHLDSEKAERVV
jgi:ATP-dependent exoDNAse (exonuclease V) beta subunit